MAAGFVLCGEGRRGPALRGLPPLCGSRATGLAILAPALASPIDEFRRPGMNGSRGSRFDFWRGWIGAVSAKKELDCRVDLSCGSALLRAFRSCPATTPRC